MVNIAADLAERAARSGWLDRPAVHTAERTWTHGQVHESAAGAATVLADHGVRPGDHVVVALPDGIGWITAFLGTAVLGATAVLVNPDLTADGHRFIVDDCKAALVVTTAQRAGGFDGTAVLDIETLMTAAAHAAATEPRPLSSDARLYVQYTSGTTGVPKGVPHRHQDVAVYARAVGEEVFHIGPDDVGLSLSKLFYAYGFGNAFAFPLYTGSSVVLLGDRQTPGAVRDAIACHGVTLLYAVPSAYAHLISSGDPSAFATVRAAVSAGENLRPGLGRRISEFLSAPVLDQLGSTEVGHAFCSNGVDFCLPGTIGRTVPGYRLDVRDKAGNPVADEVEGDLWVSGPTVMAEYLNRPQDTARTLVDGWLATHDRVVRGKDGSYRHTGRADDMEMVGGVTISPLEVEAVLGDHSAVKEVGVAVLADTQGITQLHAFVVPGGPAGRPDSLPAELVALARNRLAPHKVPRIVHLVDALPRTPNGKLRRHILRSGKW
ncbi:AMP-binding protein [Streptomyces lydicus]|uniref:AMP-binding protein n=1 Tax=Streptomyces lydicus TaxID=47763 RepID=UPI0019D70603|nr:AMP-binding protein [Streptomyces lydicus]MCZ1005615.1 AMP-binding protein [Streptomyces lydicus]